MQKYIVSSFLGLALLGATAFAQPIVIYDSLSGSVIGEGPVGVDTFMEANYVRAQSFTTGSANWTLDSVTLSLEGGSFNGEPPSFGGFTVDLFSDNDSTPGSLVGTLTGNDNPGTGLYSYTGALDLNPNSTYWMVTHVSADFTGNIFGWHAADAGTTVGSAVGAGYSNDGGATWGTDSGSTYLMQVTTTLTAVPEPSSIALGVMGGAGCLLLFRRRK